MLLAIFRATVSPALQLDKKPYIKISGIKYFINYLYDNFHFIKNIFVRRYKKCFNISKDSRDFLWMLVDCLWKRFINNNHNNKMLSLSCCFINKKNEFSCSLNSIRIKFHELKHNFKPASFTT